MDTSMTVMVVEDVVSARETVIHLLRALGFSSFVEAENGNVALEKLKHHAVDLIISDWNMPFLNGVGLLREVRKNKDLRYLPFIFLTSKSGIDDVNLASKIGVSGYVVKPVTIRSLSETLTTVLTRSGEKELDSLKRDVDNLCAAGEHAKAEEALLHFESQYPRYRPKILFKRAKVLMDAGDIDKADEVVTEALRSQPLFAPGWELKARLFAQKNAWDNAQKAMDKALAINRNNADYHVLLGSINLNKCNNDEARKNFTAALSIDPKNDQIKQNICNAYIDLDLPEEAENYFKSCFFSDLTCNTLNNMAVSYRKKGKPAKALKIYHTALAKDPNNPKVLFNTAVAYVNRREYPKARDLLLRSLDNAPDFSKAQVLLRQILEVIKKNTLAQEKGKTEDAGEA